MAELLLLVARHHADLLGHLSHEFSGGDVHVLIDRRHGERRRLGDGGGAAHPDRRGRERRAGRTTDHELRAIGYSIVALEEPEGRRAEAGLPASPTAVREVTGYLREQFPFFTPIPSWDVPREGQGFLLLDGEGRPAHRLLFAKEFFDSYGHQDADRIAPLLDQWKLTQHVEMAGSEIVLVSSYGIRVGDW
jgi:hypothetical protein